MRKIVFIRRISFLWNLTQVFSSWKKQAIHYDKADYQL